MSDYPKGAENSSVIYPFKLISNVKYKTQQAADGPRGEQRVRNRGSQFAG